MFCRSRIDLKYCESHTSFFGNPLNVVQSLAVISYHDHNDIYQGFECLCTGTVPTEGDLFQDAK
jgi:hypothetical protein